MSRLHDESAPMSKPVCLDCGKDEKRCHCPVDPPVRAVILPMPELPDDDGSEVWSEEEEPL